MTAPTSAQPEPAPGTADRRVLARIFQHPLSHNLSWRDMLALLHGIGTVEEATDGEILLRLNGQQQAFPPGRDKDLSPEEVMVLRHFLVRAGWDGEGPVGAGEDPGAVAPADLVVVIDQDGARVYAANPDDGAAPQALHHLPHAHDRPRPDDDHAQNRAEDTQFFAGTARALAGEGRIVVLGHGKGQSNAADHLMAWLALHDGAVHARVARVIGTDLSHQTLRQLLATARHALQPALLSAGLAQG
jgi:hypothetical protein